MLLELFQWLKPHFSGFNLFGYLTLRAILAAITALAVSLLIGPPMIRKLAAYKVGQTIRDDGPQSHFSKAGTPTMGGTLILFAVAAATLLWADLRNRYIWVLLFVLLSFGLIGFIDDYKKLVLKDSRGLIARYKYALQSLFGLIAALWLYWTADVPAATTLYLPILKDFAWPMGIGFVVVAYFWIVGFSNAVNLTDGLDGLTIMPTVLVSAGLGVFGFIALTYFVIVGASNAVNLTDGLDGLAIMPVVMVGSALGVFAYVIGNAYFSKYLLFPHIPGAGELLVFCAAMAGAGLAFLWFNTYPAQVFMGDVGALSLGGALGTIAVITRQEIVLGVMGGVFVVEALSVMMQVSWFKYTRKRYGTGQRILKMAPLHHHFEKSGWKETQVVVRFWIVTMLLCLVGLASLKLR